MAQTEADIFFNDLLRIKDIDPKTVLVMRHQPHEAPLRSAFNWSAITRPDLYRSYQSSHFKRQERQFVKATYQASFIGQERHCSLDSSKTTAPSSSHVSDIGGSKRTLNSATMA